jgi:hypothetical protein
MMHFNIIILSVSASSEQSLSFQVFLATQTLSAAAV